MCGLSIWTNLNHLFPRMFLLNRPIDSLLCNYLPLEKYVALHWKNLIYPSPKYALCQVWLKLVNLFWSWRRWFLNIVDVFSLFRNHFPLEKGGALQLNNQYTLPSRMIYAKFDNNWPGCSGEEDLLTFKMYFHYSGINFPWKKWGFFIKKNGIPFIQNNLC